MAKIRYSDEFVCPKCGRHTALVCRIDGTYQAHCMICDVYYDVEIAKTTNGDRIRARTDEELADVFVDIGECNRRCPAKLGDCIFSDSSCRSAWLNWLKSPVEGG